MVIEVSNIALDSITNAVFRYEDPVNGNMFIDTVESRELAKSAAIEEIFKSFNSQLLKIEHCTIVASVRNVLFDNGMLNEVI